jgi:hypothetical protein
MSIQNSTALHPFHFQVNLGKSSNPVTPQQKTPCNARGYNVIEMTRHHL